MKTENKGFKMWVEEPELRKNVGFAVMGGIILGMAIPIFAIAASIGSFYFGVGALVLVILGVALMRMGVASVRNLWEVHTTPVPNNEQKETR